MSIFQNSNISTLSLCQISQDKEYTVREKEKLSQYCYRTDPTNSYVIELLAQTQWMTRENSAFQNEWMNEWANKTNSDKSHFSHFWQFYHVFSSVKLGSTLCSLYLHTLSTYLRLSILFWNRIEPHSYEQLIRLSYALWMQLDFINFVYFQTSIVI